MAEKDMILSTAGFDTNNNIKFRVRRTGFFLLTNLTCDPPTTVVRVRFNVRGYLLRTLYNLVTEGTTCLGPQGLH